MKKFLSFLFRAVLCLALLYAGLYASNYALEKMDPWSGKTPEMLTEYGSPNKFYYSRLSDKEKHAYNEILSHIYDMPESIRIPEINETELRKVFSALLYDNPDLFFIGRKCSIASSFFLTECSLEYTMSKEEYIESKAKLDEICSEVISGLSNPHDEWQTELEIHDFVVETCEYKLVEDDFICSSSYGALVNGEAACEGYSKAAKLLLDLAGIESAVIIGESENGEGTGPHMWNIVNVSGDYYHLDCTWDDAETNSDKKVTDYAYFNLSDEMIKETHSDFITEFGCDSIKANYHVVTGGYFEDYDRSNEKDIEAVAIKAFESGDNTVRLRFGSESEYKGAVSDLVEGERIYRIIYKATDKAGIDSNRLAYTKNPRQYVLTFIIERKAA
jgi:hypothetical protein